MNEKRSSIPWGLRMPIWKINSCSRVLRLSVLPWCREKPQTAICCLEWLRRFGFFATGLDALLSSFSTSQRCSRKPSPSRFPVSPMLLEVQVKRSVIVTESLGPDIFSTLHANEGTCFVLVWNALLTKKLPMFLLSLNEISGGCEKILAVWGSFWSIWKFFKMMDFTAWPWGWMNFYYHFPSVTFVVLTVAGSVRMMARLNNRNRIAMFVEEITLFLWFQGKLRIITTKTTKSKKLRIRNSNILFLSSVCVFRPMH